MGFMFGSSFYYSKSPLWTPRINKESLESLFILWDPSWALEWCKRNYFWVKNELCNLHTKLAPRKEIRPHWKVIYTRQFDFIWASHSLNHSYKIEVLVSLSLSLSLVWASLGDRSFLVKVKDVNDVGSCKVKTATNVGSCQFKVVADVGGCQVEVTRVEI